MNRMLVIGAGASIEECKQSGAMRDNPEWQFPTISNFCNTLFDPLPTPQLTLTGTEIKVTATTSGALLAATANYLLNQKIPFDDRFLKHQAGNTYTAEDLSKSPVAIFCDLERQNPYLHNIETLCEFTWQIWGNNTEYWNSFVHQGIYFKLFTMFTQQFGFGIGRPMKAGQRVCYQLTSGDIVLNLNYDIAFDLALQQSGKPYCYSPNIPTNNVITVFKPHGSFNLYTDYEKNYIDYMFKDPHQVSVTGNIQNSAGKTFSPCSGILPPRLNKSYAQHPLAEYILSKGRPFLPKIVTFWGIGLTPSDIDLLEVYGEATANAETIEFINPDAEAYKNAETLLNKEINYFPTLHDWFEFYKIPN